MTGLNDTKYTEILNYLKNSVFINEWIYSSDNCSNYGILVKTTAKFFSRYKSS